MKIGSLFSGIGGLERGVEAAIGGGRVAWQAEIDPRARAVLAVHWPAAKRYHDVKEIDGEAEPVDIICGGFPCQDISNAGKRQGIGGARSGLWGEFARVVRALRPPLVFIENVASLTIRGLDVVLQDLAACGYDAVWEVFRAADVGAPHRRERLFVLAYAAGTGRGRAALSFIAGGGAAALPAGAPEPDGRGLDVPDADGGGRAAEQRDVRARESDAGRRGAGALADAGPGRRSIGTQIARAAGGTPDGGKAPRGGAPRSDLVADAGVTGREGDAGGLQSTGRRGPAGRRPRALAHPDGRGRQVERLAQPGGVGGASGGEPDRFDPVRYVHRFPPGPAGIGEWDGAQPAIRRGDDGIPAGLDRRWRAKNGRPDRLRLLGNAVVPQQATRAFLMLLAVALVESRAS